MKKTNLEKRYSGLTLDEAVLRAPALATEEPAPWLSGRYVFVSLLPILQEFLDRGWRVISAVQSATHEGSNAARFSQYGRHDIRIAPAQHIDRALACLSGFAGLDTHSVQAFDLVSRIGIIPTLQLINAHDGTTTFRALVATDRPWCLNGAVVTTPRLTFPSIRHHVLNAAVLADMSTEILMARVGGIGEQIERWQSVKLNQWEQSCYAHEALGLRLGSTDQNAFDKAPIDAESLLAVRREADKGEDLWSVFNRVQEGLTRGVQNGRQTTAGRRRALYRVARPAVDEAINAGLWTLTDRWADTHRPVQVQVPEYLTPIVVDAELID